jgi:hypothetical protein
MKKILFSLLFLGSVVANAQSVDEIVAKNAAAIGGVDKINAIKTATMSGVMTVQGMDLNMTIQILNRTAIRTDIEVMGQTITMVYNDGAAWQINPMMGSSDAQDLPKEALDDLKWQTYIGNSGLIGFKDRGMTAEYTGEQTVDGKKMYVIKVSSKEGNISTYFVNQADNLVYKMIAKRNMQGQEIEAETVFSNYKEINGIKFAMSRTTSFEGQTVQEMNLDKFELDKTIDASVFKKS